MKISKRVVANKKLVEADKVYAAEQAFALVKQTANTKFVGSVELHIRTGIDPKKTDQAIRGSVSLPNGTGKVLRVAAFVGESGEKAAQEAGAVLFGGESLIKSIKESEKTDFDVAVATPEMMPKLAQIAKLLGTRGLMPNPKTGTVGVDVAGMIKEIAGGKINFKNDEGGNLHLLLGKTNFTEDQLIENFKAAAGAVIGSKPSTVKGQFVIAAFVNATMGPSVRIKM